MSDEVWSARDTNPDAIEVALREMLRHRHAEDDSLAPARVLNLVVVVERSWKGEISNRLERVGRYHASRTILCAVEDGRRTLDATAVMASIDGEHGGLAPMREQVEIDLGPSHLKRLDAVIDPVIVEDLPLMLWCPHGHQAATDSLRKMTDVHLLDSDGQDDPDEALERARDLLTDGYIVDLAWLRTTPWRERLASTFDVPDRRSHLADLDRLSVRFRSDSIASALLLSGWLASRLDWELSGFERRDGGDLAIAGRAADRSRRVEISLEPAEQDAPGLAGVTVACGDALEMSLDRASGGLRARERIGSDPEREWQVLGASRGEGGILGEGVRQALLRDPTYGPALQLVTGLWNEVH